MCLNLKIPTGINSQTIIIAENNVVYLENCEMKGAWVMHILTTDRTAFMFCFALVRGHQHNSASKVHQVYKDCNLASNKRTGQPYMHHKHNVHNSLEFSFILERMKENSSEERNSIHFCCGVLS